MMSWLLITASLSPALAAEEQHIVRPGETVESIAAELGLPKKSKEIRAHNGLSLSEQIGVGETLLIPWTDEDGADALGALCQVSGEGSVQLPNGPRMDLTRGMTLPMGTRVCTGPDAYATVCLARSASAFEHDSVAMYPNTCLVVESTFQKDGRRSSVLSLSEGEIDVGHKPEGAQGDIVIRTGDGVMVGDRGGFHVTVEGDATRTEAHYDDVAVVGAGEEVSVSTGQGNRVREGQVPEAPVDLPPSSRPVSPTDGQVLRRPAFSWMAQESMLGYRLEIAVSRDFSEVVLMETVPSNEWTPPVLFLPYRVSGLWWRVSAVDRLGFLGIPSEARQLTLPLGVGP